MYSGIPTVHILEWDYIFSPIAHLMSPCWQPEIGSGKGTYPTTVSTHPMPVLAHQNFYQHPQKNQVNDNSIHQNIEFPTKFPLFPLFAKQEFRKLLSAVP